MTPSQSRVGRTLCGMRFGCRKRKRSRADSFPQRSSTPRTFTFRRAGREPIRIIGQRPHDGLRIVRLNPPTQHGAAGLLVVACVTLRALAAFAVHRRVTLRRTPVGDSSDGGRRTAGVGRRSRPGPAPAGHGCTARRSRPCAHEAIMPMRSAEVWRGGRGGLCDARTRAGWLTWYLSSASPPTRPVRGRPGRHAICRRCTNPAE
jgi:hypothetical protein